MIDYYFAKNTIGYIISIQTPQSHWKQLKTDIQFFLKHFWVGPDSKQQLKDKTPYLWPLSGKTPGRTRYFPAHASNQQTATPNWHVTHPPSSQHDPPVIGNTWYAININNQLVVGDLKTGTVNWTMAVPGGVVSRLAIHQDLLFFVTGETPNTLIGLDPDSQQIVIRTPLNEPLASPDIIIYDHTVLLQLLTQLVAIDATTGQPQWAHNTISNLPPTVSKSGITTIPKNAAVYHLDLSTRQPMAQWTIAPAESPIAHNNQIWATHSVDNTLYVHVLDTNTGAVIATLNQTAGQIQTVWPAALSQHHYGVLFNDNTGMHYLWIIDTRTQETSGFLLIDTPVQSRWIIGTPDTFEFVCTTSASSHIRSIHVDTNTETRRALDRHLDGPLYHLLYGRFGSRFILEYADSATHILSLP